MTPTLEHERRLYLVALADPSFTRTVLGMEPASPTGCRLDPFEASMVRLAALVAAGAGEVSLGSEVEIALAAGATAEHIAGVLISLVPLIGLTPVREAASKTVQALGSDARVQRRFVQTMSAGPILLFMSSP
jgi:alkylhydroperoxidase/carboxymuconolactone decarboxylase family protein YurZ